MTKRLCLFLSLVFTASLAGADEQQTATASSLKVDLKVVAESGQVEPVDGITAAGQPDEAAFKVFADKGYVAVIDLRGQDEDRGLDEPAVVEGLGMEYVAFPISSEGDISLAKAKALDDLLVRYDQPVLVHCKSSNRVGALLALKHFIETGDAEQAMELGKAGGMTRLEKDVKKVIGAESPTAGATL